MANIACLYNPVGKSPSEDGLLVITGGLFNQWNRIYNRLMFVEFELVHMNLSLDTSSFPSTNMYVLLPVSAQVLTKNTQSESTSHISSPLFGLSKAHRAQWKEQLRIFVFPT